MNDVLPKVDKTPVKFILSISVLEPDLPMPLFYELREPIDI